MTEGERLTKAARKAIKRRKPDERMSKEVDQWTRWRAAQFAHATQRKGQPTTYGTGKISK